MTDSKPESRPTGAPAASNKKSASTGSSPSSSNSKPSAAKKRRSILRVAFVVVLLVAVALAAALWYLQQRFSQTQANVLDQVQTSTSLAQQASSQADRAASLVQTQSSQITQLQRSLQQSQQQLQNLKQAFQTLTDSGSDLVLVNDIDHLVTIADQQLSLGGNVGNAIAALETAQAQLARAARPSLASLQQSINGDLDRLRAVRTVDVATLSGKLDELAGLVGRAPLLVPDEAAPNVQVPDDRQGSRQLASEPSVADAVDPDAPWWRRSVDKIQNWSLAAWSSIRHDLRDVISVRRVKDPSVLLISSEQAGQLRDNLQLRVMTSQLALMTRQPTVWTSETQTLLQVLRTHYDEQSPQTQQALKLAQQLADTSIDVPLPTVDNSLQALQSLRQAESQASDKASTTSSDDQGVQERQPQSQAESQPGSAAGPQSESKPGSEPHSKSESQPGSVGTKQPAQPQE